MTKGKTVQVSFEASITVELSLSDWRDLVGDSSKEAAEWIAEQFEGEEIMSPSYGSRAWLALTDPATAEAV